MNPVFMVLLENREQDGKEEHKMTFDMDSIMWLVIIVPCSMLFTGIGIFAWNRKKLCGLDIAWCFGWHPLPKYGTWPLQESSPE